MLNIGDHLYTASAIERDNAVDILGYADEGIACWSPSDPKNGSCVYRTFNGQTGDHLYTASLSERDGSITTYGYVDEGIVFQIHTVPQVGTVPLFRMFNPTTGDHLYSATPAERDAAINTYGYSDEGVCGHVYPTVQPNTIPLYRTFNSTTGDHFYTTGAAERDGSITSYGYTDEGISCYVPAVLVVPLFRLFLPSRGDHFYCASTHERDAAQTTFGYVYEGIACQVFVTAQPDTTALLRAFSSHTGDHLYTTSKAEFDSSVSTMGYVDEGVSCFVYAKDGPDRGPLLRALKKYGSVECSVTRFGINRVGRAVALLADRREAQFPEGTPFLVPDSEKQSYISILQESGRLGTGVVAWLESVSAGSTLQGLYVDTHVRPDTAAYSAHCIFVEKAGIREDGAVEVWVRDTKEPAEVDGAYVAVDAAKNEILATALTAISGRFRCECWLTDTQHGSTIARLLVTAQ
jgi:hypothetical protein